MIEEDDLLNEDLGCDMGCWIMFALAALVVALLAGWLGK